MEILLEDTNYVTIESLKGYTIQDLIKQIGDVSTPVPFSLVEKIKHDVVEVGEYEPQFTLTTLNDKNSKEVDISCSLHVFDSRKYYQDVISVDLLHSSLREIGLEKGLSVDTDDDEPAFYFTCIGFSMKIKLESPAEEFLTELKNKVTDIYLDGKRKAIDKQIKYLQEYKKSI